MNHYFRWLFRAAVLAVLCLLLIPTLALAGELPAAPTPHLALPAAQIWVILVGLLTPLLGYVMNTALWKTAPEPVKALLQAVVSAIAAAITTAISTSVFGLNDATLELILTSVAASFGAHAWIWRPSGIAAHLTSGSAGKPA
jgi:hypothetical protein